MKRIFVKKGYTLLELLLVVGIFLIVILVATPFSVTAVQKSRIENTVQGVKSQLFVAQQNAYARKNNRIYGVSFSSNSYSVFYGQDLSTIENTEVFALPAGTSIDQIALTNNAQQITFALGSFRPSASGTIRFKTLNQYVVLEINSEGFISWYRS